MDSQPPDNQSPQKPPAEMLTEAERAELIRERNEAQTLFQKLIEQDRAQDKSKDGGRSR